MNNVELEVKVDNPTEEPKAKINFVNRAKKDVLDAKVIIEREGKIMDWDLQQVLGINDHRMRKCIERVRLEEYYTKNRHYLYYTKERQTKLEP